MCIGLLDNKEHPKHVWIIWNSDTVNEDTGTKLCMWCGIFYEEYEKELKK